MRDGRFGYRKTSDFIELLREARGSAPEGIAGPMEEAF
jgi:hypothetical protein